LAYQGPLGWARAEHLGASGGEQGQDIVAWHGDEQWAFRYKRVKEFGPKVVLVEVDKVLALSDDERPMGHVLGVHFGPDTVQTRR
jgi:hypothetical protein